MCILPFSKTTAKSASDARTRADAGRWAFVMRCAARRALCRHSTFVVCLQRKQCQVSRGGRCGEVEASCSARIERRLCASHEFSGIGERSEKSHRCILISAACRVLPSQPSRERGDLEALTRHRHVLSKRRRIKRARRWVSVSACQGLEGMLSCRKQCRGWASHDQALR